MPPLHRDFLPVEQLINYHNDDTSSNHDHNAKENQSTLPNSTVVGGMQGEPLLSPVEPERKDEVLPNADTTVSSLRTRKQSRPITMNHAAESWRDVQKVWAGLTVPLMILTWLVTKSISALIISIFVPFSIAFFQGFLGMLKYALRFKNSPIPMAPSHGVVKCTSKSTHEPPSSTGNEAAEEHLEAPLRLLVIGDSLAIGLGQSTSTTSIMPEVIAKELSKEMGGRPVMWTCHGAPGANTGWTIRELERSMKHHGQFQESDTFWKGQLGDSNILSSTSDDSSCESCLCEERDEETQSWHDRLKQQRIRFDQHILAPFDIAVVLTGANDLKNAAFPFLAKGDDADGVESSKQGDGYGNELQRLLRVLNQRMRVELQTLRQSVEAATERVRESVDTSFRRISAAAVPAVQDSEQEEALPLNGASSTTSSSADSPSLATESTSLLRSDSTEADDEPSLLPMVVLPGMPAKSIPAFDSFPLRYLACPLIGVMDAHKRDLAERHDGEVLFVDALSKEDQIDFSFQRGHFWERQLDDNILLNIRSIKTKQKERIEREMKEYYSQKGTAYDLNPPKSKHHHTMYAVDGVHGNERGYDLWGRQIGSAIIAEWRRKQQENVISIV